MRTLLQGPIDPTSGPGANSRATPIEPPHSTLSDIRYDEDYLRFYQ